MAALGYLVWAIAMITSVHLWLYGLAEILWHLVTE